MTTEKANETFGFSEFDKMRKHMVDRAIAKRSDIDMAMLEHAPALTADGIGAALYNIAIAARGFAEGALVALDVLSKSDNIESRQVLLGRTAMANHQLAVDILGYLLERDISDHELSKREEAMDESLLGIDIPADVDWVAGLALMALYRRKSGLYTGERCIN